MPGKRKKTSILKDVKTYKGHKRKNRPLHSPKKLFLVRNSTNGDRLAPKARSGARTGPRRRACHARAAKSVCSTQFRNKSSTQFRTKSSTQFRTKSGIQPLPYVTCGFHCVLARVLPCILHDVQRLQHALLHGQALPQSTKILSQVHHTKTSLPPHECIHLRRHEPLHVQAIPQT